MRNYAFFVVFSIQFLEWTNEKAKLRYNGKLPKVDSTVLTEQLKVVSKIRITDLYRKKGKIVAITKNDFNKINSQLESLYRLRPVKY